MLGTRIGMCIIPMNCQPSVAKNNFVQQNLSLIGKPKGAGETQFLGVDFRKEPQVYFLNFAPNKYSNCEILLCPVWFQGVTKEDLERAEKTLKEATIESRLSSVIDDKSDKENKPESDSTSLRRRNYFDDVSSRLVYLRWSEGEGQSRTTSL